jgi:hypothetical protein
VLDSGLEEWRCQASHDAAAEVRDAGTLGASGSAGVPTLDHVEDRERKSLSVEVRADDADVGR